MLVIFYSIVILYKKSVINRVADCCPIFIDFCVAKM